MQGERGEKSYRTFEILCMLQGSHFTTCLTNKHRDSSNSSGGSGNNNGKDVVEEQRSRGHAGRWGGPS